MKNKKQPTKNDTKKKATNTHSNLISNKNELKEELLDTNKYALRINRIIAQIVKRNSF